MPDLDYLAARWLIESRRASSSPELDRLSLDFAERVTKRQPRGDYTIPQLPVLPPPIAGTDLFPVYRNGQTYQASASVILGTALSPNYSEYLFDTLGPNIWITPNNSSINTVYRYRILGGGAGGGGANGAGAAGSGGGAGAPPEGYFSGVPASTHITVTVGAGGPGGDATGSNGIAGQDSSIGAPVNVSGGGGQPGVGSTQAVSSNTPGGAGGTSAGATINIAGAPGAPGYGTATSRLTGGNGASSVYGNGGYGGYNEDTPGSNSQVFGAGGGGAVGATATGGEGTQGLVIIERMTL